MPGPLIVVSKFRVKQGKAADLKAHYERIARIVADNEPRVIAFVGFLDEAETEMTSVQVHPDTESMRFHMQVLKDNWDESFKAYSEMVEGTSIEYFGSPPQSALNMAVEGGPTTSVNSLEIGGFVRAIAT